MAYFLSIMFVFLCFVSTSVNSAAGDFVFDMSGHSGFIKNSDGVFSKVSDNGSVRSLTTGTSLAVQEKIPFQDSKGNSHSLTLSRISNIDTNRLGKAVTNFAKKVGPVAVGLAIADLVCDLADICNVDGVFKKEDDPNTPTVIGQHTGWCVANGSGFICSPDADFDQAVENANGCLTQQNSNCFVDDVRPLFQGGNLTGLEYRFGFHSDGSHSPYYPATFMDNYIPPETTTRDVEDSDWEDAETALNDPQFVQPLVESTADVPSDVPVVTPGQKAALGETSKPIKDAGGNITGTEVTRRDIEVIDASTVDNPNQIIIKETETVQKFDLDNNQISSDTSTTFNQQPPQQEQSPDPIITFDTVEFEALETHQIEQMGAVSSWGDGSCPPPIGLSLSIGQFEIDTTPVCDTAEHIKPFLLLLASIISIYIIAGYKQGS